MGVDRLNPSLAAEQERDRIDKLIASTLKAYHAHPADPELAHYRLSQKKVELLQEFGFEVYVRKVRLLEAWETDVLVLPVCNACFLVLFFYRCVISHRRRPFHDRPQSPGQADG